MKPSQELPAAREHRDWTGPIARRAFLGVATLAAGTLPLASATASRSATPFPKAAFPLIDTHVTLGRWPLRRLPADEPDRLVAILRDRGVVEAWAGTFEGLLHKDLGGANERLAETCRRHGRGMLVPFGSVNPRAPGWEDELIRCAEVHRMPGIRLHPNYHGYRLDDPAFADLLTAADRRGLLVQLVLVMEDERMMHPLLRVDPVDTQPLAGVLRRTPGLRLQVINALRTLRAKPLLDLLATGQVSVEIAMLEGVAGLESLLRQVPVQHVLFGSHAPLFYLEAALLKLQESELSSTQLRSVCIDNARALLRSSSREKTRP